MGEVDHQFDKYIIVSDGVAGSMAAIFSSTAKQLWQNRDLSRITTEVVTVAYGGTGRAEDMTMASVPASVQDVSLEDPFIASGLLFVIRNLLPKNYTYYDEFVRLWGAYDKAVAYPPYFAQTLPRMPVVSFYSGFMEPGAVPLQYVKMPPDEYIPSIFTKVDFGNTADLKGLYYLVASLYLGNTSSELDNNSSTLIAHEFENTTMMSLPSILPTSPSNNIFDHSTASPSQSNGTLSPSPSSSPNSTASLYLGNTSSELDTNSSTLITHEFENTTMTSLPTILPTSPSYDVFGHSTASPSQSNDTLSPSPSSSPTSTVSSSFMPWKGKFPGIVLLIALVHAIT